MRIDQPGKTSLPREINHLSAARRAAANLPDLLTLNHNHNIAAQRIPTPVKQTPTPQRDDSRFSRSLSNERSAKQKNQPRRNSTTNLSHKVNLATEN
jgi:hypothetical protein